MKRLKCVFVRLWWLFLALGLSYMAYGIICLSIGRTHIGMMFIIEAIIMDTVGAICFVLDSRWNWPDR